MSIEKEKDFMNKDREFFNYLEFIFIFIEELMLDVYNENIKWIEVFEKGVREGMLEDVVYVGFIEMVDECIWDILIK